MEMNWSYVTAYYEADGSCYAAERKGHGAGVSVSWMSTDKCVMDKIAAFLGVNVTSYKYGKNPKHKATWKTRHDVNVHDHNRLREIIPIMIEHSHNDRKKLNLEMVLKFIEERDWVEDRRVRKLKVIDELYLKQGLPLSEIVKRSDEFDSTSAIDYYIHLYGYPKRGRGWKKLIKDDGTFPTLGEPQARRARYGS